MQNAAWSQKFAPLISTLIILGCWYLIAGLVLFLKGITFPAPHETFIRLWQLLQGLNLYDQTIYHHAVSSVARWAIGFILAASLGLIIGLLLGCYRHLHDLIMPSVHVIQLIPGLAWIPIALLLFGIGHVSTIFMIFMLGVTPVIINTASGIKSMPHIYNQVAKNLGVDRMTVFFEIMLPAAALPIVSGMRLGMANAWRVLIAAEMLVGAAAGLGYIIVQARWSLDFEAAFVSIMIICGIGLIIEKLIFRPLEKKLLLTQGLS